MKHKLINSKWELTMIILSFFLILNTVVFGVPLSMPYSNQQGIKTEHFTQEKEYDNIKLELSNYTSCIIDGSKYEDGENVSGAGPCEECICRPPNIVCSMIKCPVNSGCITIQLPNKCCPKYKCDCEHKGKLYNNGEKIIKYDDSACRVCFCNGGKIVCTNIVCYIRNDCQGYYLPGECCPKFDNCSSISTPIEHKSKESVNSQKSSVSNIYHWSLSTEQSYYEDNIWKRDTERNVEQESSTIPSIITKPSNFFNTEKVSRQMNISSSNNNFEEIDVSTSSSTLEKNTIYYESIDEISTPNNLISDTTVSDFSITEDMNTSFLGFEIDNLTINENTVGFSSIINNETSEITPEFEELFDTTDIDNSVININHNDTETIAGKTHIPNIEDVINSSIEITTNNLVEIFNPNDFIPDIKRSMNEFSTVTPELDVTTELDYEEFREATTQRLLDKSTIVIPLKLVMDSSPTVVEDEINTEIKFTDLEDTTDMFGPNFGHRSYKTQTHQISIKSDDIPNSQINKVNYATISSPTTFTSSENVKGMTTTESSRSVLFEQPLTTSNIKNIENNTSLNEEYNLENISVKTTEIYNDTNFLELETKNNTCVNNSCIDYSKLNDELLDFQTETTSTTPFIIETKLLPNQASPSVVNKKILYPKEYPDEFETIQNGPALTITKSTYTSIPDIVYTTTTMITLPTLDLIYKADKEIEKYLSEMQSITIKPNNNNLSPLRNVSSLNFT